jgi:hypothetical protein
MQYNEIRGRAVKASARLPKAFLTSMTCSGDGREHWVGDGVGDARQSGRHVALCGRHVMPAALAAPPGPACPACAAVVQKMHQRRGRRTDVRARTIGVAVGRQGKHRRSRAWRPVHAS